MYKERQSSNSRRYGFTPRFSNPSELLCCGEEGLMDCLGQCFKGKQDNQKEKATRVGVKHPTFTIELSAW